MLGRLTEFSLLLNYFVDALKHQKNSACFKISEKKSLFSYLQLVPWKSDSIA